MDVGEKSTHITCSTHPRNRVTMRMKASMHGWDDDKDHQPNNYLCINKRCMFSLHTRISMGLTVVFSLVQVIGHTYFTPLVIMRLF